MSQTATNKILLMVGCEPRISSDGQTIQTTSSQPPCSFSKLGLFPFELFSWRQHRIEETDAASVRQVGFSLHLFLICLPLKETGGNDF